MESVATTLEEKKDGTEAIFIAIANQLNGAKNFIGHSAIDDSYKIRAEENINIALLWVKEGFQQLIASNPIAH